MPQQFTHTLHEYAHHYYERIKQDKDEPRFWGEILSSKERVMEVFAELMESYSDNSYMQMVVGNMQRETLLELKIIEKKYENFKATGREEELRPKSSFLS